MIHQCVSLQAVSDPPAMASTCIVLSPPPYFLIQPGTILLSCAILLSIAPRQFEEGDPVCTSVSDETLELFWNEPSVTECSGFAIVSYELEVQKYTSTEDGVLDVERLNGPGTFSLTSQPLAFTSWTTQVDGLGKCAYICYSHS